MRPTWTRTLDKIALVFTNIGGRLLGRPSDQLLTSLASQDRGAMATISDESPMVLAAHHIQLGQSAFKSEAYGEALHHFGIAIEHAPDAPWAWHGRGDALQLSGHMKPRYTRISRHATLIITVDSTSLEKPTYCVLLGELKTQIPCGIRH